jgi:hypothetical protein
MNQTAQLPARLIEAEIAQARRRADYLVEVLLTEDVLQIGVPPLHPDAGRIDAGGKIKQLFQGAACFRAQILMAAMNGHQPARIALGELVQETKKEDWPPELETFAKASANPHHPWPGKPGAKRFEHVYSDIGLVLVLIWLSRDFPNITTTSRSARRICHCDIVAGAFNKHRHRTGRGHMNRERVRKTWKHYKSLTIGDSGIFNVFN